MKFIIIFLYSSFIYCQNTTVSGKIKGFQNGDEVRLVDSENDLELKTTIKNNFFSFLNPAINSPKDLYIVIKSSNIYFNFRFYADNKNLTLTGDKSDFPNKIKVDGSISNLNKNDLNKFQIKWDSINNLIADLKLDTIKNPKKIIDVERKKRNNIEIEKLKFALDNPNSLSSLFEIYFNKEKIIKADLIQFYNKVDDYNKKTQVSKSIKSFINLDKIIKKGDQFEDFNAKDSLGKTHKISEFKKKYILLYIMQSYCFACVESNNELNSIYKKYQQNLEIVSVSIDNSLKVWKMGLQEHKPNWISLHIGNGFYGEIVQKYNATGTPTFILIDKKSKIIETWDGYDENVIDKFLSEMNFEN